MTHHVSIHHETRYRYSGPVLLEPQIVRLRPAPHARMKTCSYSLRIEPAEHQLHWLQDAQANFLARVLVTKPTSALHVTVDLELVTRSVNPFDFFVEESAASFPFDYESDLALDLAPLLAHEAPGPKLASWLAGLSKARRPTIEFLVDLNKRLARDLAYRVRLEAGVQTPEETLSTGQASCRDSAWLLVVILRNLGVAARFTSGYLIELLPDEASGQATPGMSADSVSLHAWAEAYVPGAGWIGFDVTSGFLTGEGHIPLASGRTPASAAPISGQLLGPSGVELEHEMSVTRLPSELSLPSPLQAL